MKRRRHIVIHDAVYDELRSLGEIKVSGVPESFNDIIKRLLEERKAYFRKTFEKPSLEIGTLRERDFGSP